MNVIDRFLKYVSFDTESEEESSSVPSTAKQKILASYLVEELSSIGLQNAHMDENGYVYAFLPANTEAVTPIGFISHMDTSPAVSGRNVKPRIVKYDGTPIQLNEKVQLSEKDFECLANYKGQDLIVTDGTTLLGADDKAGIAEIMSAMDFFVQHPEIRHGRISVAFTPDEEIGRGTDHFDIPKFNAEYAYTVDGGTLGEIEYENFNAATAKITVNGLSTHPGSAKNKMKNAVRIAAEFISALPYAETPEMTEGYEGFYHVDEIKGDVSLAKFTMIIRDHDMAKFEERKKAVAELTMRMNEKYGSGTVETIITDSYYNMKEKILPVLHIIENAENAMREVGVEPRIMAIRGGTDGARLSFEGLPCPNLSTGGENFHGIHEFVSVPAMIKMVEVLVTIAKNVS